MYVCIYIGEKENSIRLLDEILKEKSTLNKK